MLYSCQADKYKRFVLKRTGHNTLFVDVHILWTSDPYPGRVAKYFIHLFFFFFF